MMSNNVSCEAQQQPLAQVAMDKLSMAISNTEELLVRLASKLQYVIIARKSDQGCSEKISESRDSMSPVRAFAVGMKERVDSVNDALKYLIEDVEV